jgi:hypothetical protein
MLLSEIHLPLYLRKDEKNISDKKESIRELSKKEA